MLGENMDPIIQIDLQLFAGEKTEKATPKKREDARKKGQVLRSTELNSALMMLITFLIVYTFVPYMWSEIVKFAQVDLFEYTRAEINIDFIEKLVLECIFLLARMLAPILGGALLVALLANYLQIGVLFTSEPLKPNPGRMNPIKGFTRIFSKRAVVELVKSLWKVSAVSFVAYSTISGQLKVFPQLIEADLFEVITFINSLVFRIAWQVGLLLLVLALLDYCYQKWEYEQNLKMSKQEIKDEYKQMEGDPQIRGKIKERQRQMSMNRMMNQVPDADVVITNPTHYAIALAYNAQNMEAPTIIAKGKDLVAKRIREIAEENGIVLVENRELAQALFHNVEINQQVPEELYQAVAEVLAYVYRVKQKAF